MLPKHPNKNFTGTYYDKIECEAVERTEVSQGVKKEKHYKDQNECQENVRPSEKSRMRETKLSTIEESFRQTIEASGVNRERAEMLKRRMEKFQDDLKKNTVQSKHEGISEKKFKHENDDMHLNTRGKLKDKTDKLWSSTVGKREQLQEEHANEKQYPRKQTMDDTAVQKPDDKKNGNKKDTSDERKMWRLVEELLFEMMKGVANGVGQLLVMLAAGFIVM